MLNGKIKCRKKTQMYKLPRKTKYVARNEGNVKC